MHRRSMSDHPSGIGINNNLNLVINTVMSVMGDEVVI